ncbi:MAG: hypothetical protein KDH96_01995 [Candidatus Riesia sp.]|nr:hypothetical protein [Candidatus Riesia sp.]
MNIETMMKHLKWLTGSRKAFNQALDQGDMDRAIRLSAVLEADRLRFSRSLLADSMKNAEALHKVALKHGNEELAGIYEEQMKNATELISGDHKHSQIEV